MGKDKNTFDPDAVSSLAENVHEHVEDYEKSLEERKNQTTPKGRKKKEAKEAEAEEILIGMAQGLFTGINQLAKKYAPELEHEQVEIETLSVLSAPIAKKYVDIKASQYEAEYRLLSYLMIIEAPKVDALLSRLKKEAKEKRQQKQNQKAKNSKEGLTLSKKEEDSGKE